MIIEPDIEEWSDLANSFFAKGGEPYSVALLCSFAAPLVRLISNGGYVVNFVSYTPDTILDSIITPWEPTSFYDANKKLFLPVVNKSLAFSDPIIIDEILSDNGRITLTSSTENIDHPKIINIRISAPAAVANRMRTIEKKLPTYSGMAGEVVFDFFNNKDNAKMIIEAYHKYTHENRLYSILAATSLMLNGLRLVRFSAKRVLDWLIQSTLPRQPAYASGWQQLHFQPLVSLAHSRQLSSEHLEQLPRPEIVN